jgi:tetratricopeptide (TPR) repeat protein
MGAKKVTTVVDRRHAQALDQFERAVKALGRKDFERAGDLLVDLIASHPEEKELVERARSYRVLAERAQGRRPPRLKSFEDLLNHGVYLHNRGEYTEAIKALQHAAEIHPRNEHVLYCLAAAAARTGDVPAAVKALKGAIAVSPANRTQARSDSDFDTIREAAEFVALVHPQAS